MAARSGRPMWSGTISFGLVNVPVKLYGAIESHRVAFHEFEDECALLDAVDRRDVRMIQ